jgi:hypothetical protein
LVPAALLCLLCADVKHAARAASEYQPAPVLGRFCRLSMRGKFHPTGEQRYTVELDTEGIAIGVVQRDAYHAPTIWRWSITAGDEQLANGASFDLSRAKSALILTWKAYRSSRED